MARSEMHRIKDTCVREDEFVQEMFTHSYRLTRGDRRITVDTIQKKLIKYSSAEDNKPNKLLNFPKNYTRRKSKDEEVFGYPTKCYESEGTHFKCYYYVSDSIIPNVTGSALCLKGRGIIMKKHFIDFRYNYETVTVVDSLSFERLPQSLFEIPKEYSTKKLNIGLEVEGIKK